MEENSKDLKALEKNSLNKIKFKSNKITIQGSSQLKKHLPYSQAIKKFYQIIFILRFNKLLNFYFHPFHNE